MSYQKYKARRDYDEQRERDQQKEADRLASEVKREIKGRATYPT